MDFGNAFVYMFSSENWAKKFVIAVAMSLIPWLGWIVLTGYALDVLRNLNQGSPDPLPEWIGDDFGRWLGRGLGLSVSILTFCLPVIIVLMMFWMCAGLGAAVVGEDADVLGAAYSLCLCCIAFVLYFVISLGALVVYARYATTDRLDVGLEYGKTLQLVSTNIVPLLIIVVLGVIMFIAAFFFGLLTLGILFLVVPAYFSLVIAHFGAHLSKLPGFTE